MVVAGRNAATHSCCCGMQAEKDQLEAQCKELAAAITEKGQLLTIKEDALLLGRNQNLRLEEQLRLALAGQCALCF